MAPLVNAEGDGIKGTRFTTHSCSFMINRLRVRIPPAFSSSFYLFQLSFNRRVSFIGFLKKVLLYLVCKRSNDNAKLDKRFPICCKIQRFMLGRFKAAQRKNIEFQRDVFGVKMFFLSMFGPE